MIIKRSDDLLRFGICTFYLLCLFVRYLGKHIGRFPILRLNLKTLSYDFVTRQARLLIDMGPHYTYL